VVIPNLYPLPDMILVITRDPWGKGIWYWILFEKPAAKRPRWMCNVRRESDCEVTFTEKWDIDHSVILCSHPCCETKKAWQAWRIHPVLIHQRQCPNPAFFKLFSSGDHFYY
jgi:hypothetical protein